MREVQNGVTIILTFVFVIAVSISGCTGSELEAVPTDYLDIPQDTCTHIERYTFDTPGIEPHEVETQKECTEAIS